MGEGTLCTVMLGYRFNTSEGYAKVMDTSAPLNDSQNRVRNFTIWNRVRAATGERCGS